MLPARACAAGLTGADATHRPPPLGVLSAPLQRFDVSPGRCLQIMRPDSTEIYVYPETGNEQDDDGLEACLLDAAWKWRSK